MDSCLHYIFNLHTMISTINSIKFMVTVVILTSGCMLLTSKNVHAQWLRESNAEIRNTTPPVVEWKKYRDNETGYEIWRITSHESGAWATHFNSLSFTPDDRYLIFSSERTGSWQLFRADLGNGEIVQLTNVASLNSSNFTVHPNGKEVFFSFDGKLGRINIFTGEINSRVFDMPVVFRRVISNDGLYTLVTGSRYGGTVIYLLSLPEANIEASLNWPRGSTLTMSEYGASGLQWTGGVSHTLMNPEYPWLVTFLPGSTYREETNYLDQQNDMTLPLRMRARAWLWDARTGETRPFVSAPYHYRYTHESWDWTGERFFLFQKAQPGWVPNHISSVDNKGEDWQYHHSDDTLRLGHGASSHDGEWFISDGQDPGRNPLRLINLKTGKWKDLTWPDASISAAGMSGSGHATQSHVHPSFSMSGKYVAYTVNPTGREGDSEVYVLPIPDEVKRKLSTVD